MPPHKPELQLWVQGALSVSWVFLLVGETSEELKGRNQKSAVEEINFSGVSFYCLDLCALDMENFVFCGHQGSVCNVNNLES